MLKWLRRYSRSWFIGLAIAAIVVVFIFWGVGTLRSPRFQEAATVNGTPILMTAYVRQYQELVRQYQERFQGELTEEMVKMLRLKEQALQRLIEEALLLQAGERLGLTVTDVELREQIRGYPAFQREGRFNERLYFQMLARNRLSPGDFEAQERRRLMMQKVVDTVTSLAKVSDGDLTELFRLGKEAVAVKYLEVSPERLVGQQHPREAEVARYLQDHPEEFRVPARARVRYVVLRTQDFLARAKVTPEEVADYLSKHEEDFARPKVIRARHLLLILSPKTTAAERQAVEKLARDLLAEARGGKDFAQLARIYSQDARTREQGGALGEVRRGQFTPAWEKVAFALKPGEVGQAVTPQGIYLLKVEEIKETEKAPDAEAQASMRLKEEKARKLAQEAAQEVRGAWGRGDLNEVDKKYGVTVKETPLFAQKDPVPGLGVIPAFNQAALQLKPQEISRVVPLPDGLAVVQGMEHQPEFLPPLERIKDQVRQAAAGAQARKQAEQEAARLLDVLRQGKPLAQVAAQAGLAVKESDFFTRFQGFRGQRQAEDLTGAAFQLSPQQPYPAKPLFYNGNYYVLAFKARRVPDPGEFQRERDALRSHALEQKRQLLFASWMDGERRQATIKIYEIPL